MKVLALLMLGGAVLLFSACSDNDPTSSEETPTPTPAATPTSPPPPDGPCQKGSAVVEVTGIPMMTDESKDALNKQALFCLRDDRGLAFVGVWHRYLQPSWPHGEWWPAWRIEAGNDDCQEEWFILQAHELPGTSAMFQIDWDGNYTTVAHLGTGDTQFLHTETQFGIHVLDDGTCGGFSWPSDSSARLVSFSCERAGPPSGC